MKDLSLHILDIVQNSIEAGASLIEVIIEEDALLNSFRISIADNGRGMSQEMVKKVTDPYYTSRTTRKVGMGIPLFLHTARQSGGDLIIESKPGKGTSMHVTMLRNHIDRPILGDMAGVMSMLAGSNPEIDFTYGHTSDGKHYMFDTREVKEALDGMPISELPVIKFIREMILENLAGIMGSKVEGRKSKENNDQMKQ